MYWLSGIVEFDWVFGGGIVFGVVILLSGEFGVGKLILLFEVVLCVVCGGMCVFYVSVEEFVS